MTAETVQPGDMFQILTRDSEDILVVVEPQECLSGPAWRMFNLTDPGSPEWDLDGQILDSRIYRRLA